ncbi:MAG: regulatory protein RecX [Micromonosporaceae bacterium]
MPRRRRAASSPGRRRASGGSPLGPTEVASGSRRSSEDSVAAEPPVDPTQQAREICLRLLAFRPRTRAELAAALRRRQVPPEAAEAVLERFGEVGMIDDAAFAEAWVTSRHHGRGLARRALAHELRRRGVDNSTVSHAVDQLDPDTERETARSLVLRRLSRLSDAASDVAFRKLVGMLARKGYPPGLSVRVVREALAERSEMADGDVELDALADAIDVDDQGLC